MAGIPLNGPITLSLIKKEIGYEYEPNFSLDTAENGQYVTINPCSQYKPALANPTSLSEWYGYNHTAVCNSHEFSATISDIGTAGSCEQVFDDSEARQNSTMYYNHTIWKVGPNQLVNSLVIRNIEKFPSVRVEVKGAFYPVPKVVYGFEANGATYVPWNLVPNASGLTEYDMTIAVNQNGGYNVKIWYGDGTGRVEENRVYLTNPIADGYFYSDVYYSATSGTVCAKTSLETYDVRFAYPIAVGGGIVKKENTPVPNGYYRMSIDPTTVYQITSGYITAITSC